MTGTEAEPRRNTSGPSDSVVSDDVQGAARERLQRPPESSEGPDDPPLLDGHQISTPGPGGPEATVLLAMSILAVSIVVYRIGVFLA